ncbi:MAG: YtxH domain-containing protein [Gemmatimonadota bacterium]
MSIMDFISSVAEEMKDGDDHNKVVYVEREGGSSVKALLLGAVIGASLALMYAPQSGEETRRGLKRRLRKVRAMAEEKADELGQRLSSRGQDAPNADYDGGDMGDEDDDDIAPEMVEAPGRAGAREELERRLEQARARRRGVTAEESGA